METMLKYIISPITSTMLQQKEAMMLQDPVYVFFNMIGIIEPIKVLHITPPIQKIAIAIASNVSRNFMAGKFL